MIDLHSYKTRLESAKRNLENNTEVSVKNKKMIVDFGNYLAINGISKPRILKYYEKLGRLARLLNKDFNLVTKADIEKLVSLIHERNISMSTKVDYNIIIKRFYKWLLGKDEEYPENVKWLKTTLKLRDKPVPSQDDLITEKEVTRLIEASRQHRDRAFISLLYESGCRVGELANLRIKNVLFDQYGCILSVNGKTGPRRIRVVNSMITRPDSSIVFD